MSIKRLILVGGLGLAGIAAKQALEFEEHASQLTATGFPLNLRIDPQKLEIDLQLQIDNPTPTRFNFDDLTLKLHLGPHVLMTLPPRFLQVNPNTVTLQTLQFYVDLVTLGKQEVIEAVINRIAGRPLGLAISWQTTTRIPLLFWRIKHTVSDHFALNL